MLKYAGVNDLPSLDICLEALAANATFVARSFAGDAKQVEALLRLPSATVVWRCSISLFPVSPLTTMTVRTKAMLGASQRDANSRAELHSQIYEEIEIDEYDDEREVQRHDGLWIQLKKLDADYDPTNKMLAYQTLETAPRWENSDWPLHINDEEPNMLERLNTVDRPLAALTDADTRPSRDALKQIMAEL
ncbi:MAG: hypothetical protein R2867_23820 [Caldilineaceae bacterium]